jgi:NADH-quinone oxidoreductase subunit N
VPLPPLSDLWAAFPLLLVLAVGTFVLVADLFVPHSRRDLIAPMAGNSLLIAGAIALYYRDHRGTFRKAFLGAIDMDRSVLAFSMIFIACAFLALLLSASFFKRYGIAEGPYCCLMVVSVSGMIMMAQATDLLVLFLGLEIMSVALYIMVGMLRSDLRSPEAALKYFLTGAFASGLILYGIALIYGTTGTISLRNAALTLPVPGGRVIYLGLALLLAGFFFKIGAVPFHMWAPDVYDGAPIPVTAFLSTGVKAAAFAGLIRVLYLGYPSLLPVWTPLVGTVAGLTMIIGNLGAVSQKSLKRLLAYSSIAHAGYLLLAVLAVDPTATPQNWAGLSALLFYLVTYTLMTMGVFAVMVASGRDANASELMEDYKGIARSHPLLAATLSLFLLSLAGIPPTGGFLGKYLIFSAAVDRHLYCLAIIGVLSSVVSVYYYLRVIVYMYMYDPDPRRPFSWQASPAAIATLWLCAAGILVLGVVPAPLWSRARTAIQAMF